MINFKLHSGAEEYVRTMHFNKCLSKDEIIFGSNEQRIRNCIHNYSTPNFFSSAMIGWVSYRITNVFKSIIGVSDWQLAKSSIEGNAWRFVDEKSKYLMEHYSHSKTSSAAIKALTPQEFHFEDNLKKSIGSVAENLLSKCLYAEEHNIKSSSTLKKTLKTLDLQYQTTEILKNLKKTLPKR